MIKDLLRIATKPFKNVEDVVVKIENPAKVLLYQRKKGKHDKKKKNTESEIRRPYKADLLNETT